MRKQPKVRSRNDDLAVPAPWADTEIFKMHGTVDHPTEVVIATDDYERYRSQRAAFLRLLEGHLIGHRFLFLGFSFTDPNLSRLFGNLRETFGASSPQHYALVRRPKRVTDQSDESFEVTCTRYRLWLEDMLRYGIDCVELDEYEEVDEVLRKDFDAHWPTTARAAFDRLNDPAASDQALLAAVGALLDMM